MFQEAQHLTLNKTKTEYYLLEFHSLDFMHCHTVPNDRLVVDRANNLCCLTSNNSSSNLIDFHISIPLFHIDWLIILQHLVKNFVKDIMWKQSNVEYQGKSKFATMGPIHRSREIWCSILCNNHDHSAHASYIEKISVDFLTIFHR